MNIVSVPWECDNLGWHPPDTDGKKIWIRSRKEVLEGAGPGKRWKSLELWTGPTRGEAARVVGHVHLVLLQLCEPTGGSKRDRQHQDGKHLALLQLREPTGGSKRDKQHRGG